MATGFSEQGMLLIVCAHGSHGNNLPNRWMQERLAPGTRRAEVVRAALYPGSGNQLRGNAPRDRAGNAPQERQREIMRFITEHGERLARVATSGLHLTDDLKARILSTFLTLMNLRENLDRSSMRSSFGRSGHPQAPR